MNGVEKLTDVYELFARTGPLSEVFHRVNRVVPADQLVEVIPHDMTAGEALELMRTKGFSQLPVVKGRVVIGLFTFRAFALEVAAMPDRTKTDPIRLPVFDFLEHDKATYARLEEDFSSLIERLDDHDSIVVSGPADLVALLTPMDVLRYLYSVARAFVMIEEIELALRKLLAAAMPNDEVILKCVTNALTNKYRDTALPTRLEDMTFDDYIALVRDGRNWDRFVQVFWGTRDRTRGKLEPIGVLRNEVFHFRRELLQEDHKRLMTCRDWLHRCVQVQDEKLEGGER